MQFFWENTSLSEDSTKRSFSPSEDSIKQSTSSSEGNFKQISSSDISRLPEEVKLQLVSKEISELKYKLREVKRQIENFKNSSDDGKMLESLPTESLEQKMERFDSEEDPRKGLRNIISRAKPDESITSSRYSSDKSVSSLRDNLDEIPEIKLENKLNKEKRQLQKIRKSNDDCKKFERHFSDEGSRKKYPNNIISKDSSDESFSPSRDSPDESVCSSTDGQDESVSSSTDRSDEIILSSLRDSSGESIESLVNEAYLIANQMPKEDDNDHKELKKNKDKNLKREIRKVVQIPVVQKVSQEVAENLVQKTTVETIETARKVVVTKSLKISETSMSFKKTVDIACKAKKVTKTTGIRRAITETNTASMKLTSKNVVEKGITKSGKDVTKASSKQLTRKTTSTLYKETAKQAGMNHALNAAMWDTGVSAVIGIPFLIYDVIDINEQTACGEITQEESRNKKNDKIGEYLGSAIGNGIAGAAICLAGPVGWTGCAVSLVVGSAVSYATGTFGEAIGQSI